MPARRPGERLVGLFVLGTVLFSPPFMDLAAGHVLFGLPSAYVYVFAVWGVLIAGLAWVTERKPP
jgi:hypothetical protein